MFPFMERVLWPDLGRSRRAPREHLRQHRQESSPSVSFGRHTSASAESMAFLTISRLWQDMPTSTRVGQERGNALRGRDPHRDAPC
jgi:hypothetical protein